MPSPGLLWYDSYTAGPIISAKCRPSFLSGKRRGSSNCVYDSFDNAEGGDDFYSWGPKRMIVTWNCRDQQTFLISTKYMQELEKVKKT